MRTWIIDTARTLLREGAPSTYGPVTLDEIAACAGISVRQLRAYYTSVAAIAADIDADSTPSTHMSRA